MADAAPAYTADPVTVNGPPVQSSERATPRQAPRQAIVTDHPAYRARQSRLRRDVFQAAREHDEYSRFLTDHEAAMWRATLTTIAEQIDADTDAPLGERFATDVAVEVVRLTRSWSHAPAAQSRRRREGWQRYLADQRPTDVEMARRHADGETYQTLATEYGCSFSGARKRVARGRAEANSGSVAPHYRRNTEPSTTAAQRGGGVPNATPPPPLAVESTSQHPTRAAEKAGGAGGATPHVARGPATHIQTAAPDTPPPDAVAALAPKVGEQAGETATLPLADVLRTVIADRDRKRQEAEAERRRLRTDNDAERRRLFIEQHAMAERTKRYAQAAPASV